jgi:hypothetical protein
MPYMTFIMLRANYSCRKRNQDVRGTLMGRDALRVLGGTGASRAWAMNESLVRCSYDEMRPIDQYDSNRSVSGLL